MTPHELSNIAQCCFGNVLEVPGHSAAYFTHSAMDGLPERIAKNHVVMLCATNFQSYDLSP